MGQLRPGLLMKQAEYVCVSASICRSQATQLRVQPPQNQPHGPHRFRRTDRWSVPGCIVKIRSIVPSCNLLYSMPPRDLGDEYIRLMDLYGRLDIERRDALRHHDSDKSALLQRTLRRLASTIRHIEALAADQNRAML